MLNACTINWPITIQTIRAGCSISGSWTIGETRLNTCAITFCNITRFTFITGEQITYISKLRAVGDVYIAISCLIGTVDTYGESVKAHNLDAAIMAGSAAGSAIIELKIVMKKERFPPTIIFFVRIYCVYICLVTIGQG